MSIKKNVFVLLIMVVLIGCSTKNNLEGYWVSYDSENPFYCEITNDSILYTSIIGRMSYHGDKILKRKADSESESFKLENEDDLVIVLKNDTIIVYEIRFDNLRNPARTFVKIGEEDFPYKLTEKDALKRKEYIEKMDN